MHVTRIIKVVTIVTTSLALAVSTTLAADGASHGTAPLVAQHDAGSVKSGVSPKVATLDTTRTQADALKAAIGDPPTRAEFGKRGPKPSHTAVQLHPKSTSRYRVAQSRSIYGTDCDIPWHPSSLCFDDDDYDAGDSAVDSEIIWADSYVTWDNADYVYTDIVPWAKITDNNWLTDSDNAVWVWFDEDGDGTFETAVVPDSVSLKANRGAGAMVWYWDAVDEDWYAQDWEPGSAYNCSAYIWRYGKKEHWAMAGKPSWWEIGVDWQCLFEGNASYIEPTAYLGDYWGEDFAPDYTGDYFDILDDTEVPWVATVSPRTGVDRHGGDSVTLTGTNFDSVWDVAVRNEYPDFSTPNDSTLVFDAPGGVGCMNVSVENDYWIYTEYRAYCYD